jgi:hypothetical protein
MRTDKPLPTDTRSVRRASGFVLVGKWWKWLQADQQLEVGQRPATALERVLG